MSSKPDSSLFSSIRIIKRVWFFCPPGTAKVRVWNIVLNTLTLPSCSLAHCLFCFFSSVRKGRRVREKGFWWSSFTPKRWSCFSWGQKWTPAKVQVEYTGLLSLNCSVEMVLSSDETDSGHLEHMRFGWNTRKRILFLNFNHIKFKDWNCLIISYVGQSK